MVAMASFLQKSTGQKNLCMAGGVALNCVSNARVYSKAGFEKLWVQPAAGDAGGALGAACHLWNCVLGNPRDYIMDSARLGPEYSEAECREELERFGAVYKKLPPSDLVTAVAADIAAGRVVGWFQGAMEFGPRALGSRSIFADPRDPEMKDKLNRAIKFREGFRPFAPAVPEETARDWFALDFVNGSLNDSPLRYMLLVADVLPSKRVIPSVTHLDGSARLQTVSLRENPLFHNLLTEFGRNTGVPILINTSFNVRGEPIVCTPSDAYRCFMRTNMDVLALGNFLLTKSDQPEWREKDWKKQILDD
jgi:carbamoyltransferase